MDTLSLAITEAARATTLEEMGASALPALARALHACPVFFTRAPSESARAQPIAGEQPLALTEYLQRFFRDDPLRRAVVSVASPVNILERHVDRRIIRASRVYNEFSRHLDFEHHLLFRFSGERPTSPDALTMGFTRGKRQHQFGPGEARLAALALPAFSGAARRILAAERCPARPDDGDRPVVAMDRRGRLVFLSRSAEKLLGAAAPRGGSLPLPLVEAASRIAALVDGEPPDPHPFWVSLRLADGTRIDADLSIAHTPRGETIVLAHLLDGPRPELSVLAARHGLTRAETQVLSILSFGLSNAEIGQRLCISLDTVKTHLRRIFRKMGVTSRSQALVSTRKLR